MESWPEPPKTGSTRQKRSATSGAKRLLREKAGGIMKLWKTLLAAVVLTLGMLMAVQSAEAARIGGGRSVGAQRSITQSQRTAPAAPQAAPAQTAPQPQVQQAPNRWLAPLAGLAAGLGLGWLFAHSGASFGPLLMLMAVLFIGYMLLRMLSRPRQP